MNRVIIESPYAGNIEQNEAYLAECVHDSLERGEAPFASHGFYTRYLDDTIPRERSIGLRCAVRWRESCDLVAVYTDLGISPGMLEGVTHAELVGVPVEYRTIRGR